MKQKEWQALDLIGGGIGKDEIECCERVKLIAG